MKMKLCALVCALVVLSVAGADAQAQPSQESLVAAWEQVQRSDPETLAFEKIAERRYKFKTNRFPFDGELRVLKATVTEHELPGEQLYFMATGVIEYDLVGLSEEVAKKYEHSYERWQTTNTLYFDAESKSWLSSEKHSARMNEKFREIRRADEAKEALEAQSKSKWQWIGVAAYWAPVALLVWFYFWMINRTGLKKQREYMNMGVAHMQRSEELLERIAVAVERDRKAGQ